MVVRRLTTRQFMDEFPISASTVKRQIKNGKLKTEQVGGRWFILVDSDGSDGSGQEVSTETVEVSAKTSKLAAETLYMDAQVANIDAKKRLDASQGAIVTVEELEEHYVAVRDLESRYAELESE